MIDILFVIFIPLGEPLEIMVFVCFQACNGFILDGLGYPAI